MKPFDEMLQSGDMVRAPYARLKQWLDTQNPASLAQKAYDAEGVFRKTGITFAVYGDAETAERLIPFDIVPRIISGAEWSRLSLGIEQRVMALNAFLDDIYHRQEIVRAGIVPKHLIAHNEAFIPEMIDFRPPGNVYAHHRRGHRAHRRERILRAGGQRAHAVRRVVHAGKPRDDDAALPGAVPAGEGAPGRDLSADAAPVARGRVPAGRQCRQPDRRRAHAWHPQFRVLRTFVPRRPDGRASRRGQRPAGDRRPRRDAYDRRLPADRRAVPPGRRRVPRSAHVPPRFGARRRGDHGRVPRGQHHDRERARHRHRRRQGDLLVHAGDRRVLHGPQGAAGERAAALRRSRQPEIRARPSRRTGREGSARLGRLRDAGRAVRIEGRLEAFAAKLRARPRTTSRSRRSRCPRRRS